MMMGCSISTERCILAFLSSSSIQSELYTHFVLELHGPVGVGKGVGGTGNIHCPVRLRPRFCRYVVKGGVTKVRDSEKWQ